MEDNDKLVKPTNEMCIRLAHFPYFLGSRSDQHYVNFRGSDSHFSPLSAERHVAEGRFESPPPFAGRRLSLEDHYIREAAIAKYSEFAAHLRIYLGRRPMLHPAGFLLVSNELLEDLLKGIDRYDQTALDKYGDLVGAHGSVIRRCVDSDLPLFAQIACPGDFAEYFETHFRELQGSPNHKDDHILKDI